MMINKLKDNLTSANIESMEKSKNDEILRKRII